MKHTQKRYRYAVTGLIGATLIVALVMLGVVFIQRVIYELGQPFTWDTTLFVAVGRGILNGLVPYVDLYENKPPGIFLISALSLWLTGDMSLGYIFQAVAIAGIPIVLVGLSIWMLRGSPLPVRFGMIAIAGIFGMLLGLYIDERSGAFQVESFGAFFTILYIAIVFVEPGLRWGTMALASMALLCAVGLKEPFMLSALAAALLLYADEPRKIIRAYIVPLSIAGGVGIGLMAMLGYLWPYLSIYLPEMLGRHIFMGGTPLARGRAWHLLLQDLHTYSPFLSIMMVALLIMCTVEYLWGQPWRKCVVTLVSMVIGIFLLTFAVGIGGQFYNHHFVFAVPGYIALFLGLIRKGRTHMECLVQRVSLRAVTVGVPAFVAILFALVQPEYNLQARLTDARREEEILIPLGKQIDSILDRCGRDRYLFLGANGPQPYAYTRHSPLGPLFYQYNYLLDRNRLTFRGAFLTSLLDAQFVVFRSWEIAELQTMVEAHLREHFTEEPWSCANGEYAPQPFQFFYRIPEGQIGL